MKKLIFMAFLPLLIACSGKQEKGVNGKDTLSFHYAQNICILLHEGYTEVQLANPWKKGEVLHTYLLVPRDQKLPAPLPSGSVVRTPLQKAVVYTSVHSGLICELGAASSIAGVCERQYMHSPTILEGLRTGRIADLGDSTNPNVEGIIDMGTDALFASPFENSGGYGRVEQTGIPIIECADYMELSPLARAEWMRFYGMLFGREAEADSLFRTIEGRYLTLREQAKKATEEPLLLTDKLYGSTWYVPCRNSHAGQLYLDAHCRIVGMDHEGAGSTALSFESIFEQAAEADIWLMRYNQSNPLTYVQLAQDYRPYASFQAFQKRHIWGCNTGATDFFDHTTFHPDALLRELIIILHPELLPGEETKYFKPMK